jgi:hypothetical protein
MSNNIQNNNSVRFPSNNQSERPAAPTQGPPTGTETQRRASARVTAGQPPDRFDGRGQFADPFAIPSSVSAALAPSLRADTHSSLGTMPVSPSDSDAGRLTSNSASTSPPLDTPTLDQRTPESSAPISGTGGPPRDPCVKTYVRWPPDAQIYKP